MCIRDRNVRSALNGYGRICRRRWRYSGWRTEERLPNERHPVVSLDPDLEMDLTFVFVNPKAMLWFDRRIWVWTVSSRRRRLSWQTRTIPVSCVYGNGLATHTKTQEVVDAKEEGLREATVALHVPAEESRVSLAASETASRPAQPPRLESEPAEAEQES